MYLHTYSECNYFSYQHLQFSFVLKKVKYHYLILEQSLKTFHILILLYKGIKCNFEFYKCVLFLNQSEIRVTPTFPEKQKK